MVNSGPTSPGRLNPRWSINFKSEGYWKIVNRPKEAVIVENGDQHYWKGVFISRRLSPRSNYPEEFRTGYRLNIEEAGFHETKNVTYNFRPHISLHSSTSNSLTLDLQLLIAEDEFIYRTDFWELIKWAWIQYFSVFVIVYLITEKFLENVLSSIEPTIEKLS